MNLARGSILTLAFMLILQTGFGQDKQDTLKLSMAQAQQYALDNNSNVKSAKIDVEIAKKKVWETTAIGLPQFTVTADYQHLFNVPEFSFPTTGFTQDPLTFTGETPQGFQQFTSTGGLNQYVYTGPGFPISPSDNTTFNFTLSQLIFSGEYIVGLQAARIYKELSVKTSEKTNVSTKESVATGYNMALVLTENLKILKSTLINLETSLSEVSMMKNQGFMEETDVDQLKINKSNLETMIRSLEGQKSVAQMLLKIQLGVDFDQPIVLTDSINGIIEQANFQYLNSSEFLVDNSIDYQLMKTNEGLAALSYKREKAKFLPTVSAFYRHQQLANEPALNFQPKDVIGVSVSLPIFTSGQRLSTVGQAKLSLEKATLGREYVGQNLTLEFAQAKNDYETAYGNYQTNKESMALSEKIYNKNMIKYKEGVATSLELTQSQTQYLQSESNYYSSVLSLLNAKAKLERILTKDENK